MSFSTKAPQVIDKKLELFGKEPLRFATRAIMAGVYLGIMTAFAAASGSLTDMYLPGWGSYAFAGIFAVTLYIIIVLQGELATGDMMFMTYGYIHKRNSLIRGLWLIIFVTFFNFIGAVAISWLISTTSATQDVAFNGNFVADILEAKLGKGSLTLFFEAILANMIVNIAFMLSTQAEEDYTAKLLGIICIIPAFATMSYEHSIANFVLTNLGGFIVGPENVESFTALNVLRNWTVVWTGNLVGGGLIMGGIYGWLNLTKTSYKD